ncbi:petrobactin biosynthesis protein AsbD [Paenibacillus sp. GSMTC-2017]|uniref:petrobactin biosynthesis protein AsbD n=1 Tax=Paenibacillus sp. GSMTC-2017 TaxID=2794350 RepID=UPI0018D72423|nr:petrobactin biosynthesis protein AsbD [Paenibacillus sp. GSMTC-2017]MBH5319904.1 petrobactin biosynthesis protein AsbD [Paenibacillus sp. GSMTC-2017]
MSWSENAEQNRYRDELTSKLFALMKGKFKLKLDRLNDEMRLNEDLCIDSIMIVQLIVFIEVELGLQVPDDQIDPRTFATVGSLLDFMEQLNRLPAVYEIAGDQSAEGR